MIRLDKKKIVQKNIPEGEAGLEDTISIYDPGLLLDLEVELEISHPFKGDLFVELQSPSGAVFVLHDRQGGSRDNLRKVYRKDIFGELMGQSASGVWQLKVVDPAPKDQGVLEWWKLVMSMEEDK